MALLVCHSAHVILRRAWTLSLPPALLLHCPASVNISAATFVLLSLSAEKTLIRRCRMQSADLSDSSSSRFYYNPFSSSPHFFVPLRSPSIVPSAHHSARSFQLVLRLDNFQRTNEHDICFWCKLHTPVEATRLRLFMYYAFSRRALFRL